MLPEYQSFHEQFIERTGGSLSFAVQLADFSSFKIGGKADSFFEAASLNELVEAIRVARLNSIPYYVVGGGFNLLFDDLGFRGLIIKNSVEGVDMSGGDRITVKTGTSLKDMLGFCARKGLAGFEFLAGIPGTVGGAVFGNAGAFGESIGSYLIEAVILNKNGKKVRINREKFKFGYRDSILKKTRDTLLEVVFKLRQGQTKIIQAGMENNIRMRENKHPPATAACAGSYFKNPFPPGEKKVAAAVLLDGIGAKRLKCGKVAVSEIHANFLINEGKASSKDVLQLAKKLKKRVKDRFGITLQEEVIYLPAE